MQQQPQSHRMDDEANIERNRVLVRRGLYVLLGLAVGSVLAVVALYHTTSFSIYLHRPSEVVYRFTTEEQSLFQVDDAGSRTPFTVCGVEIAPLPQSGERYRQYGLQLQQAGEMNANTLRVKDLMDPDFYRALEEYNRGNDAPLCLLQGIRADEDALAAMQDAHEEDLYGLLKRQCRRTVDALHGARLLESYRTDVSQYVLGYLVGNNWEPGLVKYTNTTHAGSGLRHQGNYVEAWDTANTFEVILAMVLDDVYAYESGKHGWQSLVAVANWQRTDPLFHDTAWTTSVYENQAGVNGELMQATDAVKTGLFAAYHIDVGMWQAMSFEPALVENGKSAWENYLTALREYHRLPVILSDFGVSAARGVSGLDAGSGYHRGGHGEAEQAEILKTLFSQALACGFSGGCINSLWDSLAVTAWNTAPFVQQEHQNWLNAQDSEQKLGLMELDCPEDVFSCTVDGDAAEWADAPIYGDEAGDYFQVGYDYQYVYLRIHISGYDPDVDVVYLPLDITPQSGADADGARQLSFDRDADFLLEIGGRQQASLLVQAYYDATQAVFGYQLDGEDPFGKRPSAADGSFAVVRQYVRGEVQFVSGRVIPPTAVESGGLTHGTADPAAQNYNSLADYCIAGEDIEVRIPWMLLNFADPSQKLVLGDLYATQWQTIPIDAMYVSLLVAGEGRKATGRSHEIQMEGWDATVSFDVRPRLAYASMRELYAAHR